MPTYPAPDSPLDVPELVDTLRDVGLQVVTLAPLPEIDGLGDIPSAFAAHAASEASGLLASASWLRWIRRAEELAGHCLDGDDDVDGYSLDAAHDAYSAGLSPRVFVAGLGDRMDCVSRAKEAPDAP